jgi:outer membrane immunogenic protein
MRTKTKCGLAAAVVLVWGGCGAAGAADLSARIPTKAPVSPAAAPSLIDCYVGGHAGGVVSEDRTTNKFGSSNGFSSAGPIVGGQAGCDYSFAPSWILGVEGRAAWSSLNYSRASTVISGTGLVTPSRISLRNDFLASATARLGYRFAGPWLLFASGGAAWTRENGDDAFPFNGVPVDPSLSRIRAGWTVGAGVDWAFAPHWSAVVDYRYYDFGSKSALLTSSNNPATVSIASVKDAIHETSIGVNYHF